MSATFLTDLASVALLGRTISSAAAVTTTQTGTTVDCLTADGPVHFLLDCSAYSGGGSVIVTFKESSDDSTYTTFNAGDDNQVNSVTLTATGLVVYSTPQRTKRYVRAYITVTSSPTATLSVLVVTRKRITGTGTGTVTSSAPGGSY